jgi:hypothetical protein
MAVDFPDWFGQSIFPKYGVFSYEEGTEQTWVAATGYKTLLDLSLKGRTVGGSIECYESLAALNNYIRVTLDGAVIQTDYVQQAIFNNFYVDSFRPCKLVLFDAINWQLGWSIIPDITFDASFKIEIQPALLATFKAKGYLYYYNVT